MKHLTLIVPLLIGAFIGDTLYDAVAATRFRPTAELISAAHRVLDMGYDCHASGAERIACHAQLTTVINQRLRGRE